ncbi:unnamed protein product [Vicia faba]|uniref:Gag-pol polyprotein n=1 Tax=Vicia faba TaxID=3906 RepID=A0AAV1AWI6_VICFA|nr:unnamed protein product [Vicia faba]
MDSREDPMEDNLTPREETKEVQIGSLLSKIAYLGTNLSPKEESEIVDILKKNIDLFAWKPSDMPDIDPNIMCHHLVLDIGVRPVAQHKRKGGEEKRKAIIKEVDKLMKA